MACLVVACLAPFCPDLLMSIVAALAAAPGSEEEPLSPQTQRVSPRHLLLHPTAVAEQLDAILLLLLIAEQAASTQLGMFLPRLLQRAEAMALAVVLVAMLSHSQ